MAYLQQKKTQTVSLGRFFNAMNSVKLFSYGILDPEVVFLIGQNPHKYVRFTDSPQF